MIRADVLSELYGSPIEVVETPSGRLIVVGTPDAGGHAATAAATTPRRPTASSEVDRVSVSSRRTCSWDLVADWEQLTAYPFMVQALEAGAIVAVMAGAIGWFMVLRRQTFAGHTLAIISFPGAAAATLAAIPIAIGYFGACGLGALALAAVGRDGRSGRAGESAAIGTVQAFALGLGFLFVGLYGGQLAGLESLLFGTFLGITQGQVVTLLVHRRRGPRWCWRSSDGRCSSRRSTARWRGPGACRPASSASPSCCCWGWRWRRPPRSPARCSSSPCW